MKKLLTAALIALSSTAFAATLNPVQLLNPTGSTSGQAIVSTGPSTAPAWGNVTAAALAAQAANTVVANVTGSSASPTAVAVPSCSASGNNLQWTSGTGFTCATGYAQLASPTFTGTVTIPGGSITNTSISGSTGSFTTLAASSTVSGAGFSTYLASPPAIGGTAAAAGSFTTLGASGNDALFYQTTNALSIPTGTATTVTTWTKISDRVNANFNATTGVFTAPVTGQYLVSAGVTFASGMVGGAGIACKVQIVANGVTLAAPAVQVPATTSVAVAAVATAVASLTAGQTIVVQAFQNSGSSVLLAVGSAYNNYISIARLP